MKSLNLVFALAGAALLTGCIVTSVHPFYTTRDVIYEPSLVGQWTNSQEPKQSWTFQGAEDNSYRVTCVDNSTTNIIRAYLFKINNASFLDFATWEQNSDLIPPPIPSHLLLRVNQLSPELRMAPLDYDWLSKQLEADPKALKHAILGEKNDQRLVITAETAELQAFVLKHLPTEAAWGNSLELKHVQ